MKIFVLPPKMVDALRAWFHPKDRSIVMAPATFIEGEEIVTPEHPTAPGNPRHNRGRLYWKNGCWTQLDESGNEEKLCPGEWQTWFPTVTQGGAVAFTATFARYVVNGKTVNIRASLAVTGAGVAGSAIVIGGLPVSLANGTGIIGTIRILNSGTAYYVGSLNAASTTALTGTAHNLGGSIGNTPNFALANNDVIDIVGMYERS